LRLPEIMRYFLQARGQKNVLMDGSARGPELQLSAEEYQQLTTPAVNFYLPKPFRLTNVQLYVPVVKRICQEFYQRTGHVLTANLYYTPARDLPFFDYHSDPQHSI